MLRQLLCSSPRNDVNFSSYQLLLGNAFNLIDETNETHEPIYIKGKRNNAVIISEKDYEGLQETLAIYSVPRLVESILEASKEPLEEFISHEEFWKS